MDKLTVRDFDPQGKRVLVRVDFNVPIEDGKVKDDSRIRAAIPTIAYLLEHGASIVLMSHLGRPKGKVVESLRLRPVAQHLSALLRRPVPATGDAVGLGTEDAVARLKPGQLLMLENLRFHPEEEANDPEFAKPLAALRRRLRQRRVRHRPPRPCLDRRRRGAPAGLRRPAHGARDPQPVAPARGPGPAVRGGHRRRQGLGQDRGARQLMERVDTFVIGGGMANTFLVAQGHTVGKSLLERDRVEDAERLLAAAETRGVKLLLPTDVVVAKEVTRGAEHKIVPVHKIPNSWSAVDIGPETLEAFGIALEDAQDRPLERAAGRVRGADVRRRHARHGALPRRARRDGRDGGRRRR